MIPVIKDVVQPIGEHNPPQECVRTESVAHLIKYPFPHLNPMQSLFAPFVDEEKINVVVASPTCSGKTVVAELGCAQTVFASNRQYKAMFLAPMRALADEKLNDWTDPNHTLSVCDISALSSDYVLNKEKKEELLKANIIVCTSEMLDSKTRNYNGNPWLHNVRVLVVDESHLIGSKGRGPRLETAIMRFIGYNPDCRLILMSATVPNSDDYVKWLEKLTGRKTILIRSTYRPCKLNRHFLEVDDTIVRKSKNRYHDLENARMDVVLAQIKKNPHDQHLVFTGNKSWGKQFVYRLEAAGFSCDFHNADLGPERRRSIERNFNNGQFQVLVASSTLAWGVNINARRVILAHTTYGIETMEVADIDQACGRAGRVKYHTEGDAYIVVEASKKTEEIRRINGGFSVTSKLNDVNTLLFHVINEIDCGKVKNKEDLYKWYEKSLASVQNDILTEETSERVLRLLAKLNMVRLDERTGNYVTTKLGHITNIMYQDPLNVAGWFRNFSNIPNIGLFYDGTNKEKVEAVDVQVCWALANVYEHADRGFLSSADKESPTILDFANRVGHMTAATKVASLYYCMMKGYEIDDNLRSTYTALYNDLPRVISTLKMVHQAYKDYLNQQPNVIGWRYNSKEWDVLMARLKYSVPRHLTPLASLPEVGKVLAERLYASGLQNRDDVLKRRDKVAEIIGPKRAAKMFKKLDEEIERAAANK